MTRKKVLVFIDWFRPGFKAGGPVQSLDNLTARLVKHIDFDIITRITDYCDDVPYNGITPGEWVTRPNGVRVCYLREEDLSRELIREKITAATYDYYYINGVYSRWFSIVPMQVLKQQGKSKQTIIAARGMLAPSARAIKAFKKKLFLLSAKWTGLYREVTFHATATQEVTDIRDVLGDKQAVRMAENLTAENLVPFVPLQKSNETLRLICLARIAPEKNTLYALRCLQQVACAVHIDFYGTAYDEAYKEQCRNEIEKLPANITANWCGVVDATDVPALLQRYHALLLPTRGENFGHVILETFAVGRPVIISDQTPWKNLEAQHCGFDLPLENEIRFAAAVEKLAAMDEATYANWCTAAYEKAKQFIHDPEIEAANLRLFSPAQ
jgi:glycosyltransferase involved in cell wall biosynthesis